MRTKLYLPLYRTYLQKITNSKMKGVSERSAWGRHEGSGSFPLVEPTREDYKRQAQKALPPVAGSGECRVGTRYTVVGTRYRL